MTCNACAGSGVVITEAGDFAKAEVCPCHGECKACKGARYTIVREGIYDVAHPCECVRRISRVRLYNEAELPARYAQKHLGPTSFVQRDNESLRQARDAIGRYAVTMDPAMRGLVLSGAYGLGKTHLVCGLAASLTLKRGVPVRFADYYGLLSRIRATFSREGEPTRSSETEHDIVRSLVEVPVLIIDDMGKGQGSAWELSILDQVITRRYNTRRLIIATTNYLLEKDRGMAGPRAGESLEARIGERLVSRLREACDVLVVAGDDYRVTAEVPKPAGVSP